jgi:hypothetical protein
MHRFAILVYPERQKIKNWQRFSRSAKAALASDMSTKIFFSAVLLFSIMGKVYAPA